MNMTRQQSPLLFQEDPAVINLDDVRYQGDARDVKELYETYRVEDYLKAFMQNLVEHDRGIRERFLKFGIRLTERISPRIFGLYNEAVRSLGIEAEAEVFCLPEQEIQASAIVDMQKGGKFQIVGITAGALERLEDKELVSILGHEIGHLLFENNRLNALLNPDPETQSLTVLPPLGESLFLRWRKKAEISADRIGLLASGDFVSSARALLKATFGLDERNLNLDVDALLDQMGEIKGHPEIMEETFSSHPLLPIRLRALELFSRSEKAKRNGFEPSEGVVSDDDLEKEIADLILLTRRYPVKPLHVAVMRSVALGGALLLGADKQISDEEVKVLIHVLHQYFTDEPEDEIVTDRNKIEKELPGALATVRDEGVESDKSFLLSRLADIALADGALLDPESGLILKIAEDIGFPTQNAYGIIIGAAQSVGFRTDVKLNRIAGEIRRSLTRAV